MRINKQTVIFVTKDKCNEDYAEYYRKKCLEGDSNAQYNVHVTFAQNAIDKEEFQKMFSAKRTKKQIADHFGVSLSSVNKYIQQNSMVR